MPYTVSGYYVLAPVSDRQLKHSCSSGSTGWNLINNNSQSSYIYTNSTSTVTSLFNLGVVQGNVPSRAYTITSVQITATHKADFNNSGTGYFDYSIHLDDWTDTTGAQKRTSKSVTTYTKSFNTSINCGGNYVPDAYGAVATYRASSLFKFEVQVFSYYVTVYWTVQVPIVQFHFYTMDMYSHDELNIIDGYTNFFEFDPEFYLEPNKITSSIALINGVLPGEPRLANLWEHDAIGEWELETIPGDVGWIELEFPLTPDNPLEVEGYDQFEPYIVVSTIAGRRMKVIGRKIKLSWNITQDTIYTIGIFSRKRNLYVGNEKADTIYSGTNMIQQVYKGTELIFGPPKPTTVWSSSGTTYREDEVMDVHPLD